MSIKRVKGKGRITGLLSIAFFTAVAYAHSTVNIVICPYQDGMCKVENEETIESSPSKGSIKTCTATTSTCPQVQVLPVQQYVTRLVDHDVNIIRKDVMIFNNKPYMVIKWEKVNESF